jgi:hypothetical protein
MVELGYLKLTAFAPSAAAQAYVLGRLHQQTTLLEVSGGRGQPLELARVLGKESRPLLEKALRLGARARVAARLIAVRLPDASGNERRRQARRAKARLRALAGPSDSPGLAPLQSHRARDGVDAHRGLHGILLTVASRTGVQVVDECSPSRHAHPHDQE